MSDYTPEDLAAVKDQVQPPPVGVTLGDVPAGGSATEVDVAALMARMDAMAKQLAALQASSGTSGEHNLIGAATAAKDLIEHHFEFHPKRAELSRLADDLIDAARNSVDSGDTGPARTVADKLRRKLEFWNPGPGDHHYFRQALGLVSVHVPDAADTVTAPAPSSAGAIGSGQTPAKVVAGNVTG